MSPPGTAAHSARLQEGTVWIEAVFLLYIVASFFAVMSYVLERRRAGQLINGARAPLRLNVSGGRGGIFAACVMLLLFDQSPFYMIVVVFGLTIFLLESGRTAKEQFGLDRLAMGTVLQWSLLICGAVLFVELPLSRAIDWMMTRIHLPHPEQESVEIFRHYKSTGQIVAFLVQAVLISPMLEELFFRGFLLTFLKNYTSTWAALILSAGVFAFAHANLGSVLQLWVLGLVLGLAYEHTGSLLLPIGIHACWNLLTAVSLLLDRGGLGMNLQTLGENGLLRLLTRHWKPKRARVLTGVGDDCAVLRGSGRDHFLIFKTDAVVEGVHFTRQAPPEAVGRKALARALSDLAAMGAAPLAAVITLGVAKDESPQRLRAIYRGLERTAKKYEVDLVGGETTRAAELFLNVALLGECRGYRPVLRSGARAGDLLFVTGRLGGAQAGRHLVFEPRLAEGRWLAEKGFATALMDLSDGLGADLPRLAQASGVSFQLHESAIPRARGSDLGAALTDGEDYELLFTVKRARAESLKKMWPFATPLHCIGTMRSPRKNSGTTHLAHGFDHFK